MFQYSSGNRRWEHSKHTFYDALWRTPVKELCFNHSMIRELTVLKVLYIYICFIWRKRFKCRMHYTIFFFFLSNLNNTCRSIVDISYVSCIMCLLPDKCQAWYQLVRKRKPVLKQKYFLRTAITCQHLNMLLAWRPLILELWVTRLEQVNDSNDHVSMMTARQIAFVEREVRCIYSVQAFLFNLLFNWKFFVHMVQSDFFL